MRFIRSRRGAVVLALVVVGFVATLSAQGNNGNPAILQAVQAVQSTLNSLVAITQGKTLFTPPLYIQAPDSLLCSVANVSSTLRNVTTQLIDVSNGTVLSESTNNVLPGHLTFVTAPGGGGIVAFCKVTVNDGVKTDVRGVLVMIGTSTGSFGERNPIAAE